MEEGVKRNQFHLELERAAALNLDDLRKEMIRATGELPGLTTKSAYHRMAIAFEAGRRIGMLRTWALYEESEGSLDSSQLV